MRVLGIGAHVDDLQLCAGGTFLGLAEMGAEIEVLYACDFSGVEGLDVDGWEESLAAVGARPRKLLGLPWLGVQDCPELRGEIEAALLDFRPDLIFSHWPRDRNGDHMALGQVVLDLAGRYEKEHAVYSQFLHFFAVPNVAVDFQPTLYVDIARFMEQKVRSLELLVGVPGLAEPARVVAAQLGMASGVRHAEAFRPFAPQAYGRLPLASRLGTNP